jgi:hypothetical protein
MTSHHRKKFSDEPFVGYIFDGPPPRQHRLWFIDRHVATLLRHGNVGILHRCQGVWKITDDPQTGTDLMALTGVCLHYEHTGSRWYDERMDTQRWTAVWKLTDLTIPPDPTDARHGFGVHTFGRDDDVWRLGLWPD